MQLEYNLLFLLYGVGLRWWRFQPSVTHSCTPPSFLQQSLGFTHHARLKQNGGGFKFSPNQSLLFLIRWGIPNWQTCWIITTRCCLLFSCFLRRLKCSTGSCCISVTFSNVLGFSLPFFFWPFWLLSLLWRDRWGRAVAERPTHSLLHPSPIQ